MKCMRRLKVLLCMLLATLCMTQPLQSEAASSKEIQKEITALNKKLPSFKQIHKLEFRKTEFEKTSSRKIKRFLV